MSREDDLARAQARLRGRLNAVRGEAHQELIGHRLRLAGLEMVERIETGWKIDRRNGRICSAWPIAKVHGDWSAIVPGTGRSVRCEAKARVDDQLSLSDFEPHQIDALTLHTALGGLSLVGWVSTQGAELLLWPIAGLVKGKPLNAGDERTVAARWQGLR